MQFPEKKGVATKKFFNLSEEVRLLAVPGFAPANPVGVTSDSTPRLSGVPKDIIPYCCLWCFTN
jgi:hypothetical protein